MITVFSWLIIALSVSIFGLYCRTMVLGVNDVSVGFYDTCEYYYALNERHGVHDPPTCLQEKRFDIERAVKMSAILVDEPSTGDLDEYTLTPADSTTVHPMWNTDHVALGDMCG